MKATDRKTNWKKVVKELRKRLGLTQTELADRVGVSFCTVNRWERGHSVPSQAAVKLLSGLEREAERGNKSSYKGWWSSAACPHLRTVRIHLGGVTCVLSGCEPPIETTHPTVMLEGCLDCGRVRVVDYGE